jgi:hypothetical protein
MTMSLLCRRVASTLAVSITIIGLTGCGSIRGERVAVSEDGTAYDVVSVDPPTTTIASASASASASTPRPAVEVRTDTPNPAAVGFSAKLLGGGTTSGSKLAADGPVHLVFFQPTCPFSNEEGPKLAAAALRHPDITYVVAHSGGTAADYDEVIADAGLDAANIVHVDDTDQVLWARFGVTASPSSILIDGSGLLRSSYGALGDSGLDRAAETLLTGF